MQSFIQTYLNEAKIGRKQSYRNLAVFPLLSGYAADLEYITLDETWTEDLIEVMEKDEAGSVPELKVLNKSPNMVLILDGEELVGAKQSRIVNTTILVQGKSTTVIPVSCVEQGRWAYESRAFSSEDRLKQEITSGGGVFGEGAAFNRYRIKMGNFMTHAVGILDGLKQGATQALRQEIAGLEALLVSSYITLTPTVSQAQNSTQQLTEVQADLENAFLQLVNIGRLLEQERRELQINSELVMARLVLQRLGEGPLSNGRFFSKPRAIKDALKRRQYISREIRMEASGSGSEVGVVLTGSPGFQNKQVLDRIRRAE